MVQILFPSMTLTTVCCIYECNLFLFHSVTIRQALFFLRLLHCLILRTRCLYEFIKLLKQWYAESNFISQIITFSSRCFICSLSKTCRWRCNEVWETDGTCKMENMYQVPWNCSTVSYIRSEIHFWMGVSLNDARTHGGLMELQTCFSL